MNLNPITQSVKQRRNNSVEICQVSQDGQWNSWFMQRSDGKPSVYTNKSDLLLTL